MIIKMVDKMAAAYQFASIRCCGHSYLVIINLISSKFHIWIALSNPGSSLNMSSGRQTITKMAKKMAAHISLHPSAVVVILT